MTRARRAALAVLSLLFAAGLAWWCLYLPDRPRELYRAIPAGATVVAATGNLATQWVHLAANPLARVALGAAGLTERDLNDSLTNRAFAAWLGRLAGREVLAAYVPRLSVDGEPGWVLAARLGADSRRLRWSLSAGDVPGIRKVMDYRGHPVWQYRPKGWRSREMIHFALPDGMLLVCLSARSTAMITLLETHDGSARAPRFEPPDTADFPPDRVRGEVWLAPGRERPFAFAAGVAASNRLALSVRTPWAWPADPGGPAAGPPVPLADALDGWMVFPRDVALAWLTPRFTNDLAAALLRFAGARAGDRLGLGLLAADHSGRFKGMKVPTLLLASAVTNAAALREDLSTEVDLLNVSNRLGLVLAPLETNGAFVAAFDGVMDTDYGRFTLDDSLACLLTEGAFVLASNTRGLTNALGSAGAGAFGPPVRAEAPVHGFFNLRDGGKAIRLALAAWSVKLAFDDPEGSEAPRRRIEEAKAWIDVLGRLEFVTFTARAAPDIVIDLDFGPP